MTIFKHTLILTLICWIFISFAEEEHYTKKIFRKEVNVLYVLTDEFGCIEESKYINSNDSSYGIGKEDYLKFSSLDSCIIHSGDE